MAALNIKVHETKPFGDCWFEAVRPSNPKGLRSEVAEHILAHQTAYRKQYELLKIPRPDVPGQEEEADPEEHSSFEDAMRDLARQGYYDKSISDIVQAATAEVLKKPVLLMQDRGGQAVAFVISPSIALCNNESKPAFVVIKCGDHYKGVKSTGGTQGRHVWENAVNNRAYAKGLAEKTHLAKESGSAKEGEPPRRVHAKPGKAALHTQAGERGNRKSTSTKDSRTDGAPRKALTLDKGTRNPKGGKKPSHRDRDVPDGAQQRKHVDHQKASRRALDKDAASSLHLRNIGADTSPEQVVGRIMSSCELTARPKALRTGPNALAITAASAAEAGTILETVEQWTEESWVCRPWQTNEQFRANLAASKPHRRQQDLMQKRQDTQAKADF